MKQVILSVKEMRPITTKESVLDKINEEVVMFDMTFDYLYMLWLNDDCNDCFMMNYINRKSEPYQKTIEEVRRNVNDWCKSILIKNGSYNLYDLNFNWYVTFVTNLNKVQFIEEIKFILINLGTVTSNLNYLFNLYSDFVGSDGLNELIQEKYPFKQSFEDFETDCLKWINENNEIIVKYQRIIEY